MFNSLTIQYLGVAKFSQHVRVVSVTFIHDWKFKAQKCIFYICLGTFEQMQNLRAIGNPRGRYFLFQSHGNILRVTQSCRVFRKHFARSYTRANTPCLSNKHNPRATCLLAMSREVCTVLSCFGFLNKFLVPILSLWADNMLMKLNRLVATMLNRISFRSFRLSPPWISLICVLSTFCTFQLKMFHNLHINITSTFETRE